MAAAKTKNRGEIDQEFDRLDQTVNIVGNALLAEIERLRALLRQHQSCPICGDPKCPINKEPV